jgi:hypothetical protein
MAARQCEKHPKTHSPEKVLIQRSENVWHGDRRITRMGRIRASFGHFLDVASEEVACSSGVLLSDATIRRLAGRYRISELRGMTRAPGRPLARCLAFLAIIQKAA